MSVEPAASRGGAVEAPGLRRRLACLLYEGLLLFGIGLVSGLLSTLALTFSGATSHGSRELILQGIGIAVYGAYFVWFWSQRGQTLPMQTWHIKLVTVEGRPLSPVHALVRYVACAIWVAPAMLLATLMHWPPVTTLVAVGLGVVAYALLALLQPQRQFWHDIVCRTRLISTRPTSLARV
jgi:uncharacterized RDD family membrane protein YckC